MNTSQVDLSGALAEAVAAYRDTGELPALLERLDRLAEQFAAEELIAAVEPYRQMVEVTGPLYERIVEQRPTDSRALVILANCYWLSGRGPEVVSELATRAMSANPEERGAWHLWALAESELRDRVARWQQVVERFPDDQLARVNLADNAASLASTEHDEQALALAITTYESLLASATHPDQRQALDEALGALRRWRL